MEIVKPVVIMLQETMLPLVMACNNFLKCFPLWKCCGVDANGLSSGLLIDWNMLWLISIPTPLVQVYLLRGGFVVLIEMSKS